MKILIGCVALLFAANAKIADAGLLLDYSPGTSGASIRSNSWSNVSTGQNWGERISFTSNTELTGMDIYSGQSFGSVGQSATIRIWSDLTGQPGTLLHSFTESISAVDSDGVGVQVQLTRKHVDFTSSVSLTAGVTYWIGMSGTSAQLALTGLNGPNTPDDARMALFTSTTFRGVGPYGDAAMRLYGTQSSSGNEVPEPTSLAIFGLGALGLAGGAIRRRKKQLA